MRISDWSSDVCSSDLIDNRAGQWRVGEPVTAAIQLAGSGPASLLVPQSAVQTVEGRSTVFVRTDHGFKATPVTLGSPNGDNVVVTSGLKGHEQLAGPNSFTLQAERSEEHTSELQSLIRTSYAVFC